MDTAESSHSAHGSTIFCRKRIDTFAGTLCQREPVQIGQRLQGINQIDVFLAWFAVPGVVAACVFEVSLDQIVDAQKASLKVRMGGLMAGMTIGVLTIGVPFSNRPVVLPRAFRGVVIPEKVVLTVESDDG